jgi:hypothetical protein
MISNRLITSDNVAFNREDLKNAEKLNKDRMVLVDNQPKADENKQEKFKVIENNHE